MSFFHAAAKNTRNIRGYNCFLFGVYAFLNITDIKLVLNFSLIYALFFFTAGVEFDEDELKILFWDILSTSHERKDVENDIDGIISKILAGKSFFTYFNYFRFLLLLSFLSLLLLSFTESIWISDFVKGDYIIDVSNLTEKFNLKLSPNWFEKLNSAKYMTVDNVNDAFEVFEKKHPDYNERIFFLTI